MLNSEDLSYMCKGQKEYHSSKLLQDWPEQANLTPQASSEQ